MVSGYFHYKKSKQVLTVHYTINACQETGGQLLFSSSLWKPSNDKDAWNRKAENLNAYRNYRDGAVQVLFDVDHDITDHKVDDVWLKKYIHRQLTTKWGRQSRTILDNTVIQTYKNVEECWKARGHLECEETDFDRIIRELNKIPEKVMKFFCTVYYFSYFSTF